ncbi:MAG: gluconokinase [Chitinophagaceae bacterium]|nr:gluconokinase [Chitinophagaceae bacterium]
MAIIIGVDIGTTNIKLVAGDDSGVILLNENYACPVIQVSDKEIEQDPALVLHSVNNLLKKAFSILPVSEIKGVCFSSAMHNIIAVDENGALLTNAILWGDTRSEQQATIIKEQADEKELYQYTGVPVHPSLPLCKILWLKQEKPEIFNRAQKFISIKEYLFFKWFGKYIIDHSIAGATGMLDVHNLQWSKKAMDVIGITENKLSAIVPVTHIETDLVKTYADLFGLQNPISFIAGSSDGCLANIGSGVFEENEATLTIGTSGAVRITRSQSVLNEKPALFCYPVLKNLYVKGGAVNNGGNTLQWYAQNFAAHIEGDSYEALVEKAASVNAGADGLIFLPYLQGERAPIWNASARGVFFGINSLHNKTHFLRAVIEGICFGLYDVFCEVAKSNKHIDTICVSGGFTKSDFWVQMIADIFNKKVIVSDVADASATGAIQLGMYATGLIKEISHNKVHAGNKIFEPVMERHNIYSKQFEKFCALYESLKSHFTTE